MKQTRLNQITDLKDLTLIVLGFILFVTPMVVVMLEGMRSANWIK